MKFYKEWFADPVVGANFPSIYSEQEASNISPMQKDVLLILGAFVNEERKLECVPNVSDG